jgi:hypothetical protein
MPLIYTTRYPLELMDMNPHIKFVYMESHLGTGGGRDTVKVRNLEKSLPLTLRNHFADDGYLTADTEARDIPVIENQFQTITHHLRMGDIICLPTTVISSEITSLEKRSPKVGMYLSKRLDNLKNMFLPNG